MRLNANQILAIVLAVFAVGYVAMAFQIRVFPLPRPIDSDLFPKILGALLFGLSVLLFLEAPERAEEEQAGDDTAPPGALAVLRRRWMEVAATAAAVALYALLLRPLGFLPASVVLVAGLTRVYGYRNHLLNIAVAIVVPLILYLVLTRGLGIHLPRGVLPL